MAVREFLRGTIEWDRLEAVGRELARRSEEPRVRVAFLEADNWLSTPCVIDERWFVKVISERNSVVHALFTGARNVGAFSSGTEGFFEHVGTPIQMAEHELEATHRMRSIGVNAPEPIEAFEVEGLGVLVMEYLPAFRPFTALDPASVRGLAPGLLGSLATMHRHGLVHGDLRGENVLVHEDAVYFIDATSVRDGGREGARAYDLASALATLTPVLGPGTAVRLAAAEFTVEELLAARAFLDFVNLRPDHDFDAVGLRSEVDAYAA